MPGVKNDAILLVNHIPPQLVCRGVAHSVFAELAPEPRRFLCFVSRQQDMAFANKKTPVMSIKLFPGWECWQLWSISLAANTLEKLLYRQCIIHLGKSCRQIQPDAGQNRGINFYLSGIGHRHPIDHYIHATAVDPDDQLRPVG